MQVGGCVRSILNGSERPCIATQSATPMCLLGRWRGMGYQSDFSARARQVDGVSAQDLKFLARLCHMRSSTVNPPKIRLASPDDAALLAELNRFVHASTRRNDRTSSRSIRQSTSSPRGLKINSDVNPSRSSSLNSLTASLSDMPWQPSINVPLTLSCTQARSWSWNTWPWLPRQPVAGSEPPCWTLFARQVERPGVHAS